MAPKITIIIGMIGLAIIISASISQEAYAQFRAPTTTITTTTTTEQGEMCSKTLHGVVIFVSEDCTNPIPIISGSMLPDFRIGGYATLNFSVPFEEIEEGDIIVFDCTEETGKNMMHRVTDVDKYDDGSRAVETVGDANDGEQFECEKKISVDEYIGKIIDEESISYKEAFMEKEETTTRSLIL